MIDELIAGIVLFKNFILLTLAAGIIGSLLAVIGTRKFSWNGRARGVYGFLINRSDREAVCFAVSLLGFLFVLSSVICWLVGIGDLGNIHYSRVSSAPMNL